jgi:ferrous iron transport protein B
MTLVFGDLKVGDRARVMGFEKGDIAHRQKLLSLGLTPGAEFTIKRIAPLGDPVEIRVRDTSLSIRKNETSALLIERLCAVTEATGAQSRPLNFAIIGNPNTGKSTLFNTITGVQQRVGNWPGVTVEKKVGLFQLAGQKIQLVDLPGIYSLDSYEETGAVDERIAQDYILSGEADLIIDIVDAAHLVRNLYLTTQLLEMQARVVVVLNIMEEAEGYAELDVDVIARLLGCPVVALVATKRRDAERLKAELLHLVQARPQNRFAIDYPPLIENAVSDISQSIKEAARTSRFDDRWLALRLLEGDAFASRAVDPATKTTTEGRVRQIAQESGNEADIVIANCRYRFVQMVADRATPKYAAGRHDLTAAIDRVVLNRMLGIPIFLAVMYCLFWFTIQLSRAFKPFFNQVSDALFVEGSRQLLGVFHAPAWLIALLADGVGNGVLQVINFIPIIGFLYLFVSVLEESGYMARANFVMDRLMQALGLPGNAFVPMMVGFGCNVPAIMATRTLERARDRVVAVLMSPFMSCGGRLAVYTVFAAAFFPEHGHFVIFGIYLLGVLFAMISALIMKNSLLPQEPSLFALELPSYHWPKLRNVFINAWIRVKVFVFRVGKFIVPMVLIVKVLSVWGTDGSFNQQPIEKSVLAATGRAITPVLAPMGVEQDQWPATVALLTGVLHKVVIVSTLESIYIQTEHATPSAAQGSFDLTERLERALLTIPQNLKALVGIGRMRETGARTTADKLVDAAETREHAHRRAAVSGDLGPALANHFDGKVGALAYLILLLCYPCIATTAATARETNQRWTGFMVFWTLSLGYGMAVLFYQIGTFVSHPISSAAWVFGVVLYFSLLGAAAMTFSPFDPNAVPLERRDLTPREGKAPAFPPSRGGVAWAISTALMTIALGAMLIGNAQKRRSSEEAGALPEEKLQQAPMQETRVEKRVLPAPPRQSDLATERQNGAERSEPGPLVTTDATGEKFDHKLPNGVELKIPKIGVEAELIAFLGEAEGRTAQAVWFDLDRVRFETGEANLQPSSRDQLQIIARILAAYPNVKTIIAGHPDNIGNAAADRRLSKVRAGSVARALTEMGTEESRLEAKGYSSRRPAVANQAGAGVASTRQLSLGVIRERKP